MQTANDENMMETVATIAPESDVVKPTEETVSWHDVSNRPMRERLISALIVTGCALTVSALCAAVIEYSTSALRMYPVAESVIWTAFSIASCLLIAICFIATLLDLK